MTDILFDNQRLIVGRKGHPLVGARSMDELAGAHWVRPTHIVEGGFEEMFTRLGLPSPKVVLSTRLALATVLALVNSELLTVVPRQWLNLPILAGPWNRWRCRPCPRPRLRSSGAETCR